MTKNPYNLQKNPYKLSTPLQNNFKQNRFIVLIFFTWCRSYRSLASSSDEHFGSSVAQYFSALTIHGMSCSWRLWYLCQWATLPDSAVLRSLARAHRLSHCLRTLVSLDLSAAVSRERKFWDNPRASFSRFSRVMWFSYTSEQIVYKK